MKTKNKTIATRRFCVYHASQTARRLNGIPKLNSVNYTLVAVVETEDISDVWKITNSITSHWSTNPEVKWSMGFENRSTSIGDVVSDDDGKFFRCGRIGWEQLKV